MSKKLRRALSTTCNILRQMADQALETGCTQDLRAMHRSYRRLQKVNAAVPRRLDQHTTNAPHNKPHYHSDTPRRRAGTTKFGHLRVNKNRGMHEQANKDESRAGKGLKERGQVCTGEKKTNFPQWSMGPTSCPAKLSTTTQ